MHTLEVVIGEEVVFVIVANEITNVVIIEWTDTE